MKVVPDASSMTTQQAMIDNRTASDRWRDEERGKGTPRWEMGRWGESCADRGSHNVAGPRSQSNNSRRSMDHFSNRAPGAVQCSLPWSVVPHFPSLYQPTPTDGERT